MSKSDVFEDEVPSCPGCASHEVVPIIYTPPSDEMFTAAKLRLIVLADTPASAGAPQWKCQSGSCDYSF
jgi:hypothetical protein